VGGAGVAEPIDVSSLPSAPQPEAVNSTNTVAIIAVRLLHCFIFAPPWIDPVSTNAAAPHVSNPFTC
jgi:hypothetical protein